MRFAPGLLVFALAASWPMQAVAQTDKPPPTWKQKQEASVHFKAGVRAFVQHKYVEAAELFEKANDVVPSHKALFNAADAWEKGGELVTAAMRFRQFLEVAPESDKARDDAQTRLEALIAKVGRLELAGEDARDVAVDGASATLGELLVAPGEHVVTATVGDHSIEKRVTVEAGALLRVLLEPPPPPEPVATIEDEAPSPEEERSDKGMSPTVFYVGLGVTTVLAGATAWSGMDTRSQREDFDANPTAEGYDEGVAAQKRTNVLLGITAAAGVTTAALGLFGVQWDQRAEVALSPHAASVRLRF
jgi:hypothetical protein